MIALSFYAAAAFIMKDITADFFGLAFVVSISFIAMAVLRHLVVLVENARLGRLASTDGLTGLYHFRYFEVKLNSEVRAAKEAKADLSLVIFDIDHFKEINDNYGHDLGNEILRRVARAMRDYSRKSDTVARFGGDEFAAILPQAKLDDAYKFAESVKAALRNSGIVWNGKPLDVSISAGASALFINGSATAEDLIRFADRALYDAKSHRIDKRNMR
jgi:diguanylate cyclase (GGDEF)-like protein